MKNFLNLSSIITYIDLFGQGINLRIDKKEKSKNRSQVVRGGLVSGLLLTSFCVRSWSGNFVQLEDETVGNRPKFVMNIIHRYLF